MAIIESLYAYPLKSGQGSASASLSISRAGIENDRIFCIADAASGKFLSARDLPCLSDIGCTVLGHCANFVDTRSGASISCRFDDFQRKTRVQIWQRVCPVAAGAAAMDEWFGAVLVRKVVLCLRTTAMDGLDFFDTAPVHLIAAESLREIGEYCSEEIPSVIFRPNLVISGIEPCAEERFKTLRLNEVEFEVVDLCDRCSMLDMLMQHLNSAPGREPGTILEALRYWSTSGRGRRSGYICNRPGLAQCVSERVSTSSGKDSTARST